MELEKIENFIRCSYFEKVTYLFDWNNYEIYEPIYKVTGLTIGPVQYVLVKDDMVRWNTNDEREQIFDIIIREKRKNGLI